MAADDATEEVFCASSEGWGKVDLNTDKLADDLYDASLVAKEVHPSAFRNVLSASNPGHDAIDNPEEYRWFLIERFPTKALEVTLKELMLEAGDRAKYEKWSHDRIVDLLNSGAQEWPILATAEGVILDGYHRIAAHRTLKDKKVSVIVAVMRPGNDETAWDSMWNENVVPYILETE